VEVEVKLELDKLILEVVRKILEVEVKVEAEVRLEVEILSMKIHEVEKHKKIHEVEVVELIHQHEKQIVTPELQKLQILKVELEAKKQIHEVE
jgi:hypothetical protein